MLLAKPLFLRVCLCFLLSHSVSCNILSHEHEAIRLIEKCKNLTIGMNKKEVIKIMGSPINTVQFHKKNILKERLFFKSPKLASEFTQCSIDIKTELIEEVICGEGYRISIK